MNLKYLIAVALCIVTIRCGERNTVTPEFATPEIVISESFTTIIIASIWKQVEGAINYEIRYATESNMSDAVFMEFTSTTVEITGLKVGSTYYLQVRANNGTEWGEWSETKMGKTAAFVTTVGTYNIFSQRYDKQFPNFTWSERKEATRDIIKQSNNNPDILGIQETMITAQMNEFEVLMGPSYGSYISSREISPRAIFWKADLYSMVSAEDIEIIPDAHSGYLSQRYATHVRLKHTATKKEIDVFNIHLPSGKENSRQKIRNIAANTLSDIILNHYEEYQIPVIVLGDNNNYFDTVIDGIAGAPKVFSDRGFTDTYQEATYKMNGEYMTMLDKIDEVARIGSVDGMERIDYIFTYPQDGIKVSDFRVVINFAANSNTELQKPIPSDHNPVRSTLYLFFR